MEKMIQDILEATSISLGGGVGEGAEGVELHHQLYNQDYFIIGTHKAKSWIGEHAFDVIAIIKDYEDNNFGFGEGTDFSNPEKVVNMFVYIVGDVLLSHSTYLNEDCYEREMTREDLQKIRKELGTVTASQILEVLNDEFLEAA